MGKRGKGRERKTNPLPVKHPLTIQDGGIENLVYRMFHSKITPALQATQAIKG